MTRDFLAKICAASFALAFWGGVVVWMMDNGLFSYPQDSLIASVLLLSIAFGSLMPIAALDGEGFTTKPLNDRIQIAALVALLVGCATVLFVVELRTPVWLALLLFAPISFAFVMPGFAFQSAERSDPGAATQTDQEAPESVAFSKLQWCAAFAVVALVIWTTSHAQFYSRVDRGGGLPVGILWFVLAFPPAAKMAQRPFEPLFALIRRTGASIVLRLCVILLTAFGFYSLVKDVLPYALTKRFGTDTEYEAEVRGRTWYPNRFYCKGELEITESRGARDFDRCFDHPSDYPGFEVGTQVQVTQRKSFAGHYVSEMRVVK